MDIATVLEEYLADITSLPGDIAFIIDELKAKDVKLVDAQRRIQQRDGTIQKYVESSGAMQEFSKEQAFYPKIRSDFQDSITLQQEKVKLAIMGLYLVTKHVSKLDSQVAQLEAEGQLAPVVPESDESLLDVSMSPEPQPRSRKSMSDTTARRVSRLDQKEKTPALPEGRPASHSRSGSRPASSSPAPASLARAGSGSGSQPLPSSLAAASNGPTNADSKESERDAVEMNGVRVSLKRNHTSPRQRPPGLKERDEAFCYCKKGSVGNMIACDSDNCAIEWFHWDCVGLTEDPKGSWYCPDCREKVKKQAK